MLTIINTSQQQLIQKEIKLYDNRRLQRTVKYFFIYITDKLSEDQKQVLYSNMIKSNSILIKYLKPSSDEDNDVHLYIVFKNTIMITKPENLKLLHEFFSASPHLTILFDEDEAKKAFDENIRIKYDEIYYDDFKKIKRYSRLFSYLYLKEEDEKTEEIYEFILKLLSTHYILEAYTKKPKNRSKYFLKNYSIETKEQITSYLEFSITNVYFLRFNRHNVSYHYKTKELFVTGHAALCNFPFGVEDDFFSNKILKHPYLPQILFDSLDDEYGFEIIKGHQLTEISKLHLNINDKITIIFKILILAEYLQRNDFNHNLVTPLNIFICKDNEIALSGINMIINSHKKINKEWMENIIERFLPPKTIDTKFEYFQRLLFISIGMIIYLLITEKPPANKNQITSQFSDDSKIVRICKNCINDFYKNQLSIVDLIIEFYFYYHSQIDIEIIFEIYIKCFNDLYDVDKIKRIKEIAENKQEIDDIDFKLGLFHLEGKVYPSNIEKANHYFSYSNKGKDFIDIMEKSKNDKSSFTSNFKDDINFIYGIYFIKNNEIDKAIQSFLLLSENEYEIHYFIGCVYFDNFYVEQNILKAIHFFSISAEHNHAQAQLLLGDLYYNNKYVFRDIHNVFYYYSMAAENGCVKAQSILGLFYYEDIFVYQDIQNSIYYFTKAANQNDTLSQYYLGLIYYENKYTRRDILKAIHFFSLSAEKNHIQSLLILGNIYSENKFVVRDAINVIYYFSKAAALNVAEAQFNLGMIYMEGMLVKQDLNKAVGYFHSAANQNYPCADFYFESIIRIKNQYIL